MKFIAVLALLGSALNCANAQTLSQLDASARAALAVARYSPETAAVFGRMEVYLRSASPLGLRRFALLGLITAREMNLAGEWGAYERAASRAGLEPAVVEVIRQNEPVTELDPEDALIIDFGRELFRERHVSADTFAALLGTLGRQGLFDAIMGLAYPAMTGLLERAVGRQAPVDGDQAVLPAQAGVGTPPGRPGDFIGIGPRPPVPADIYEDSGYRFPLLERTELNARGREIFDRLVGTDAVTAPRGPVGMTLNSPELAEPVQQINTALRVNSVIGRRTSEVVIATTGREMNSQYQWLVHGAAAAQNGAGPEVLEAIRDDSDLSGLDDRDAVTITFVRELFREPSVRPETLAAAVAIFGSRGAIEIAALAGDYLMMTTVYNALGMRLRPDQEPTLPHRAGAPVGAEWR